MPEIMYDNCLKYVSDIVEIHNYRTGLRDYIDIDDIYAETKMRNRVVAKIDLFEMMRDTFTAETVSEYRDVLLMIAEGEVEDAQLLSNALKELYLSDPAFKKKLKQLIDECPPDEIIGEYIEQALANRFIQLEQEYKSAFRNKDEVVVCVSHGYLYYSFSDDEEGPMLPFRVESEAVSNAKKWQGNIRYM